VLVLKILKIGTFESHSGKNTSLQYSSMSAYLDSYQYVQQPRIPMENVIIIILQHSDMFCICKV